MRTQSYPLPFVPYVPKCRVRADILKIYHDMSANGTRFGRSKTTRRIQVRFY